jgi:rubrerythrin
MAARQAAALAAAMQSPPVDAPAPDVAQLLFGATDPPPFPEKNIFPLEWRTETPKLRDIYESGRDPGWSPAALPWHTLDPAAFTPDQRYAISYWFALLSVFDSSGPAAFARAMIRTYEHNEEDPVRKCFFLVTRDEVNHEEVCQRVITTLTPGGPLKHAPTTDLGKLALNNVRWYFHNGARYWTGYKSAVDRYPLAILFTSFLMGEIAAATLFHGMYQRSTIPVLKEAFRCVGKDEARHMAICLAVLQKLLPQLSADEKALITKQLRAGYVFLSGILYEPPEQFWELGPTFRPAHRLLEAVARDAGLGILSLEARRDNWRAAVLKMKGVLEPHGIAFPAIPEIGVDGETVAFDPDDIIPVF